MIGVINQTLLLHFIVVFSYGTVARQVQIIGNITEKIGTNGTMLTCNFTLNQGDNFNSMWLLATNMTLRDFENVAYFDPDLGSHLQPFGKVLFGNASLSSVNKSSKSVSLSFDDLNCKHSRLYRYELLVRRVDAPSITTESEAIGISIQVPPSAPEAVTLMNLSISTTTIITVGDTITYVCSGDVGKPPGKFRFQHFRSDHILYKNFTSTSTSISEISDNCSYYRTSYITFLVTAEDNQAVIRCVVESPLSEISMFVDSEPLEVYYAVKMPTIVKLPTKKNYLAGKDTSINLKCYTDGNPKPSYVWYTDNTVETLSTSENLTITEVSTTNRCIYTCFVSNTFNGVIYTKRGQMHVCKKEGSENSAVIVLGTVCGSIILVLFVVLFGVTHNKIMSLRMRNLNDRSLDYVNSIQQQDLSLYESVGHALEVHHYEQPSTEEHQYTNNNLSGSVGHALDVHHYEQPSTGENQYTNNNLSGSVGHALDVHHYEQPSSGEHRYINTNLSGN